MSVPPSLPATLTRLVEDNLREIPDFPEPGFPVNIQPFPRFFTASTW